jgi:hypothetical protein
VARTLLDFAEVANQSALRRALDEAERLRVLELNGLHDLLERSFGRRGLKPLRIVLPGVSPVAMTRSELEEAFIELCDETGLPPPVVNARIAGHEVDAVWPDRELVVELDGFEYHRTAAAFERDRARDADLQIAGFRVLRFTYRRVMDEPQAVVTTIATMLSRGRQPDGTPA